MAQKWPFSSPLSTAASRAASRCYLKARGLWSKVHSCVFETAVQVPGSLAVPGLPEGEALPRAETGHKVSLPQRAAAGRHGHQRHRRRQPVNGGRCEGEKRDVLALRYWCRLLQAAPSRLSPWPRGTIGCRALVPKHTPCRSIRRPFFAWPDYGLRTTDYG